MYVIFRNENEIISKCGVGNSFCSALTGFVNLTADRKSLMQNEITSFGLFWFF